MKKLLIFLVIIPASLWSQDKTDFTLKEAVDYALQNAYAIKNANDDIAAAKKKVWETTTMGLPQINAKVDYQDFIKQPVSLIPAELFGGPPGEFAEVSFGTKQNMKASATLTQLLFDGSYIVGLQSSRVYLKISESIKTKTNTVIKEGVTNAYAGVLMIKESINILKKNKAILEKNVSDTQEIVKNGFAEEQDAEQLQLTLNQLNNQLKNMQRLLTYNLNMLKYAMGISIDNDITLSQNLDDLVTTNDLELTSIPFKYKEHIDYIIGENNIKANELFIKLEQSKALPSLVAYINYGLSAYGEEFKFFSKSQKWFDSSIFGVGLNIPIFSSLKRNSRVQQAKIELKKAERAQDETTEKLKLAYQTALIDYKNALETYQAAKESLALAERIEKKENIKFFEGVSGSFQLSNAQNQLYSQQQQYLQAIFDLISKKVALETILNR
jgi:outer membrane protein TolC